MSSPSVARFFERFPDAQAAYAASQLYHLTHSRYVPGIQANGLCPNAELFPPEQGTFLLDMCTRYGSGHPADIEYIQNRILDADTVYLSTVEPDMEGPIGYGMPERLLLLMRGMSALAAKESLLDHEREFAAQALKEHRLALTEGDPSIVTLELTRWHPLL